MLLKHIRLFSVIFICFLALSCENSIENYEVKVSSISIKTLPKLLYCEGEQADWSGLELAALYTDGRVESYAGEYTISVSQGTVLRKGNHTVEITAMEKQVTFPVIVQEKASELQIPVYEDYGKPSDSFDDAYFPDFDDMEGLEIKAWFAVNCSQAYTEPSVKNALLKQNVTDEAGFYQFIAKVSDSFMKKWAQGISSGGISEQYDENQEASSVPKPSKRVDSVDENFVLSYNDDGTAAVWYFNSYIDEDAVTDVVIPSELNGYKITEIKDDVFQNNINLMSVSVPDTVRRIGNNAFWQCLNLEKVVLPETIDCIGNNAFDGCINLSEINIPQEAEYIGSCAFARTKIKSAVISENIGEVGATVFDECTALTSITWNYEPKNIRVSDDDIYYMYNGPYTDDIASIGTVLSECEVTVGDNVTLIPEFFMQESNVVTVKLGTGVKYICSFAFSLCEKLKNINLENVSQINSYCFYNCTSLESIGESIPPQLIWLGREAFYNCKSLYIENPVIPNKLHGVSEGVFKGCTSLKGKLTIETYICPSELWNYLDSRSCTISKNAFAFCTGLTEVQFGTEGLVKNTGEIITGFDVLTAAFLNCSGITKVTVFGEFIFNEEAFYNCSRLTTVDIPYVDYLEVHDALDVRPKTDIIGITVFSGCPLKEILIHSDDEYNFFVNTYIFYKNYFKRIE